MRVPSIGYCIEFGLCKVIFNCVLLMSVVLVLFLTFTCIFIHIAYEPHNCHFSESDPGLSKCRFTVRKIPDCFLWVLCFEAEKRKATIWLQNECSAWVHFWLRVKHSSLKRVSVVGWCELRLIKARCVPCFVVIIWLLIRFWSKP